MQLPFNAVAMCTTTPMAFEGQTNFTTLRQTLYHYDLSKAFLCYSENTIFFANKKHVGSMFMS